MLNEPSRFVPHKPAGGWSGGEAAHGGCQPDVPLPLAVRLVWESGRALRRACPRSGRPGPDRGNRPDHPGLRRPLRLEQRSDLGSPHRRADSARLHRRPRRRDYRLRRCRPGRNRAPRGQVPGHPRRGRDDRRRPYPRDRDLVRPPDIRASRADDQRAALLVHHHAARHTHPAQAPFPGTDHRQAPPHPGHACPSRLGHGRHHLAASGQRGRHPRGPAAVWESPLHPRRRTAVDSDGP
jgi:hypothetical protein